MMDQINYILFWIFLCLLQWQTYILLFNGGVPNISTAPAIRKAMIKKLKQVQEMSDTPLKIYDLGCANGSFVRAIARQIPKAQVIGIELSRWDLMQARLWQRLFPLPNLTFRQQDFYQADFHDADVALFFLVGTHMGHIRKKLSNTLKSGTLVISNKFPIGGAWQPLEVCTVKTLAPVQKTFYVYRVTDHFKQEG